ncbi:triose-phosphate transporter [Purpureocillium lilacinum]|uniref:Triose-phosphate transporter n=1 Tax=Purpureocillium lilacinum TaxID=33203 RepID=A0A179HBU3_PURLI|nr:triose-phosphate transporter [Purpureocillium lilacinum]
MSLPSPSTASRSSTTTLTALSIDKGDDDGPPWDAPDKPAAVAAAAWQAPFGIMSWIFLSNLTILLNKWLIDTAGFRYPILLACWHFIFTSVTIHILARTTTLLDSRHSLHITPRIYARTIIPIGVCFSLSLICSNVVYLYLSVAFIQMLNAANPVAVLAVSWIWGVADPSTSTLLNMLLIVAGAAIASFGEIQFSTIGFVFQAGGIIFGAIRLVMIQVLVSRKGMRMDPLVGLYYFGPACAIMTLAAALFIEVHQFRMSHLIDAGVGMLVLNAAVAFLLNVTTVYLVGRTSGLVMALTGIFKNILLIAVSVVIWNTKITLLQAVGYSLALGGNKGYFECLIRLASVRGEYIWGVDRAL